jgi:hypothetical protein
MQAAVPPPFSSRVDKEMKQANTPLHQQQQMMRAQGSSESSAIGKRCPSDKNVKENTSPTGTSPRTKLPPRQAVAPYSSTGSHAVVTDPPVLQHRGHQMPRLSSDTTMEYSEVSPQHNRSSGNEPSYHTDREE